MKCDINDILGISVSYYKNIRQHKDKDVTIADVLRVTADSPLKSRISTIRRLLSANRVEEAKDVKQNLPAVTFSGTYLDQHSFDMLVTYNNILVIDIDHLDREQIDTTYHCLCDDVHVIAFWQSPSGRGYKGLIPLAYEDFPEDFDIRLKHKASFRRAYEHFFCNYGIELDKSGSDPTRLCYISWDPDICVKKEAECLVTTPDDVKQSSHGKSAHMLMADGESSSLPLDWKVIYGRAQHYSGHQECRFKLASIIKKLKKRHLSITNTYEEWVRVAYAIASNLHPEIGRKMFLELCELDGTRYDKKASERLIYDAYTKNQGKVTFASIIYLARQNGLIIH